MYVLLFFDDMVEVVKKAEKLHVHLMEPNCEQFKI